MKRALLKDSIKEIKNTYKRFISILLMAFLGVGFFAGLRAASPDMVDTLDAYFKEQNVYDIKILSTLGLTDDDIDALKQIDNVSNVYGEYSQDVLLNFEDTEVVAKVMSIDSINEVKLLEGQMPQNSDECLVEKAFCEYKNKKVGDTLTLESDEDSIVTAKNVKIVGVVNSPLYITRERDSSKLGAGKVDYNIFMPKESFDSDIYTEIYIKVKNADNLKTGSTEYENYIEEIKDKIDSIKEQRQKARYDEVINEANKELEEAEQKLADEKNNAQTKISDAENKIEDGKSKLKAAQNTLDANKKNAQTEFKNAEKSLIDANAQIAEKTAELEKSKNQANSKIQELNTNKAELESNLQTVNSTMQALNIQYEQIVKSLQNQNLTQEEKNVLEQNKQKIESQMAALQTNKAQLESGINEISRGIETIQSQIAAGEKQIEEAKSQIDEQQKMLDNTKKQTNQKFETAQNEINDNAKQLEDAEKELNENKAEYEEKIRDAEQKLIDARTEISKIENPKWYVLDRTTNTGYNSFIQDTKSIENLGKVFPIVFFVIATLISLTSMTRMVEEQRVQLGTLKALGYNKMQIASKYLIYASLACIIGGSFGMVVGFQILPSIIWMMYKMMYTMNDIIIEFNWYYAILGLGLASICIIGATLWTSINALRNTPAELMRPKAPKPGKRVLLEKIPFIWKHLNFSNKVTVRNIFRYKKRFLMTIIGIAGCTGLILVGFGIKDAVTAILPNQFEKVYNYDMQISLKSGLQENELEKFKDELQQKEGIETVVETYASSGVLINGENEENAQIIVPKDENVRNIISLKNVKTKEDIELQIGKIAITDKVAQLLNVQQGDKITLRDIDNKEIELEISDIVENYVYHYVYMSKDTYEQIYGKYEVNLLFVKDNLELEQEQTLSREILQKSEVNSISLISTISSAMDNMMSSLNYVVIILIVSAGLLAFVVLYNLSNVNISERIRELATIKVLGFYDKEVYKYVARETIILTVIGIVLGLGLGYLLNYFILGTCEINILRFTKDIHFVSYVYAVIITVVFTLIVNVVTYFALKKIDMIESLKSIE